MTTRLTDMESAVWSYLNSQAAFTALGLTEFRGYDGTVLVADAEEGIVSASWLPAITGESNDTGPDDVAETGSQDVVDLTLSLFYGTGGAANQGRGALDAARDVLVEIVDSHAAKTTGFASSGAIHYYDWRSEGFNRAQSTDGSQILIWTWAMTLTLRGAVRYF